MLFNRNHRSCFLSNIPQPIIAQRDNCPEEPCDEELQSLNTSARPISNGESTVVKTADFSLPNLMYVGWPLKAAANVAFSASIASHGTTTTILGITRIKAMSSRA